MSLLGQCKALKLSDGDWLIIKPCPFSALTEFICYIEIFEKDQFTASVLSRFLSLITISTRTINVAQLTSDDIFQIIQAAIALNQTPDFPDLINEDLLDVKIPSSQNYYADTYVSLLNSFPEQAATLISDEGKVVIDQLLWRKYALSKYDDYLELAKKEQIVKSQEKVALKLATPEGKAMLKQMLGE